MTIAGKMTELYALFCLPTQCGCTIAQRYKEQGLIIVDEEFFAKKIFWPGFIFVTMTIRHYKLTPFIRQRKYFSGLIFVVEGDWKKFFATKIS